MQRRQSQSIRILRSKYKHSLARLSHACSNSLTLFAGNPQGNTKSNWRRPTLASPAKRTNCSKIWPRSRTTSEASHPWRLKFSNFMPKYRRKSWVCLSRRMPIRSWRSRQRKRITCRRAKLRTRDSRFWRCRVSLVRNLSSYKSLPRRMQIYRSNVSICHPSWTMSLTNMRRPRKSKELGRICLKSPPMSIRKLNSVIGGKNGTLRKWSRFRIPRLLSCS